MKCDGCCLYVTDMCFMDLKDIETYGYCPCMVCIIKVTCKNNCKKFNDYWNS